ncbi:FAD-dependent monooxygenase [Psychromarinibacter sp. C21-152]|uniref:FAD-dependent monooxygenase n=1 Tax=Psychromarinibacter sediminicola TaxID=3033385 RepID=A0AAE3TBC9_9RHOB|nr:FAD-dependent monooxygenase [Psychromarinibacter sediminicola]MDF0603713.1 FAD-dependent monooxygenase [Psychromarinibacter sediminicola]
MRDVVIIGGGPAGLGAAIAAADAGLDTLVIARRVGSVDKACGEGLMPAAVENLSALGVAPSRFHRFRGVRYIHGKHSADGHFRRGPGLGVRRTVLQDALNRRARELGVEIRQQTVRDIAQTSQSVTITGETARFALVADGLQSPIRRRLGLSAPSRRRARLGLRRHFAVAPWSDFVEVHWSDQAEAYVTPIAADLVGVAVLFYRDAFPAEADIYCRILSLFPALRDRLPCRPCSARLGAGPFEQRVLMPMNGRILLIGDAAGYLDPLTGEGIRLGLDSARAAVACITQGRPETYPQTLRRVSRRYWSTTGGLLWLRDRPVLRDHMVPVLWRMPWLFDMMLSRLAEA